MSPEGFWLVQFAGAADRGFGILVLVRGLIVGANTAGGQYDGTYQYKAENEMLEIDMTVKMPPNVLTVQGVISRRELVFNAQTSIPCDAWEAKPFMAQTDLGPVNGTMKKIRDYPEN